MVRWHVWHATRNWVNPIASIGSEYSMAEKLYAFRELNWRLEIALLPLFENFAEALAKFLEEVDLATATTWLVEFSEIRPNPKSELPEERALYPDLNPQSFEYSNADINESWKELSFGVLRYWREERNQTEFDKWFERIKAFKWKVRDDEARLAYEQSLWGLAHLNTQVVEVALAAWPENVSLIWKAKQVSILLQIGNIQEANAIGIECYERIQRTLRNHHVNLSLVSLEAWVVMILNRIQHQLQFGKSNSEYDPILHSHLERRIGQLSRMKYDPWHILEQFRRITEIKAPSIEWETITREFHRQNDRVTYKSSGDLFEKLKPAFEILRFSEEAPFPPQFANQNLCSDAIQSAAIWLVPHEPVRVDSIMLQLKDEKLIAKYLSKHRVAAMPQARLEDLYKTVKSSLTMISTSSFTRRKRIEPREQEFDSTLRTAMDVVGRLIIRMPVEEQKEVLDLAIKLYQSAFISQSLGINIPLKQLFQSLFTSLPLNIRREYFLQIVNLPIPNTNGFHVANEYTWPYPLFLLVESISPSKLTYFGSIEAQSDIERILDWYENGDQIASSRALIQLEMLYRCGCLSNSQEKRLGKIYWRDAMAAGLPNPKRYSKAACLSIPAPESIDVEQRFKETYLSFDEASTLDHLMDLIEGWIYANQVVRNHDSHRNTWIKWKNEELESEMKLIELAWGKIKAIHKSKMSDAQAFGLRLGRPTPDQMIRDLIFSIRNLIIAGASFLKSRLNYVIDEIKEADFPIGNLFPVLDLVESKIAVEQEMRSALASHDRDAYVSCLSGMVYWAENHGQKLLPSGTQLSPVPPDAIRELGIIVANRRQPNLDQALAATSYYIRSAKKLDERFVESVLTGLEYLFHELQYTLVESKNSSFEYDDVPMLREYTVSVAAAVSHHHGCQNEIVLKWIEAARNDPLPEVRNALLEIFDAT
jgi:hypothetical protein